MSEHDSERYRRGWKTLQQIDAGAGQRLLDTMSKVAPDLARYAVEFPFGDIYQRPGLNLEIREIINVAALTALANARPQLKVHIHGALNVGVTRQQIVEIMIQMAVYAGFPAAMNGASAAQEVFAERDAEGIAN